MEKRNNIPTTFSHYWHITDKKWVKDAIGSGFYENVELFGTSEVDGDIYICDFTYKGERMSIVRKVDFKTICKKIPRKSIIAK
jgi:hypothetical protein